MADPDTLPDDAGALDAELADLGRRIDVARADADRRAAAPPARPFPTLWLVAAVLVIAMIAGGLALAAAGGDDDDQVAGAGAGSTETTVAARTSETTVVAEATETTATTAAPAATETTATTAPAVADAPADPAAATPRANAPNQTVREITVVVGDSFWSIAEREVGAQLGRVATDAEVTGWWADFVAANADRLVEPGNPNLVLPGQVLVAPPGAA